MQSSRFNSWILGVCLTHLTMASAAHAEIYKWVDGDGRTHYSERKEAAGDARTEELKLKTQPISDQEAGSLAPYSQEQSRPLRAHEEQEKKATNLSAMPARPPKSLSGGRADGTDASRCALARDVLNGAVKHTNGKATDAYDIKVAQNDVRNFCH